MLISLNIQKKKIYDFSPKETAHQMLPFDAT